MKGAQIKFLGAFHHRANGKIIGMEVRILFRIPITLKIVATSPDHLQTECDSLRGHITVLGDKYNTLALRHIQYKAKRKFQLEELRGRLDAGESLELSHVRCGGILDR